MHYSETTLSSVFVIDAEPFDDERGRFARIYCRQENSANGLELEVAQINRSRNFQEGTVRGMHYQVAPALESKRVSCVRGSIYDVILDVREGSPTFLQWVGVELSAENMRMVQIPKGCAHGFQTLEPETEVIYLHSTYYAPDHYRGIRIDDPRVNIRLPLRVSNISEKDANFPLLSNQFSGIRL